ncbi:MAG: DUF166 family protein [Promethearchaeati archaeon SRVP18_Atabeyarchaeia-1]
MRIYFVYTGEFGERVIGNLVNDRSFCKVCGASCTECRWKPNWSFADRVVGVSTVPDTLPVIVDDPETYMPKNPPKCDVLVSIGIHPDVASTLPLLAKQAEAKAVIAPVEDPKWMSRNMQTELEKGLAEMGIESAFPKPFCSLEPTGGPTIDSFIKELRIGRPLMHVTLQGARIADAEVLRSAPCGCTWYIAETIKNHSLIGLEERIALSHHSYPCTASMENDPVLKEKILHKAGYMAREAVKRAIDEFVLAHPEVEQEVMQAVALTGKETQVPREVTTASDAEREIREVFAENAAENNP